MPTEHRILDDIFRVLNAADHSVGDAEETRAVALDIGRDNGRVTHIRMLDGIAPVV